MKEDVCAAHSLLVDNVRYIRKKQDETANTVQEVSTGQEKMGMEVAQIKETQQEILRLLKKRRWTPGKVAAACAAIFGSGSAFPPLASLLITKLFK